MERLETFSFHGLSNVLDDYMAIRMKLRTGSSQKQCQVQDSRIWILWLTCLDLCLSPKPGRITTVPCTSEESHVSHYVEQAFNSEE